jgi:hypothetical protein
MKKARMALVGIAAGLALAVAGPAFAADNDVVLADRPLMCC